MPELISRNNNNHSIAVPGEIGKSWERGEFAAIVSWVTLFIVSDDLKSGQWGAMGLMGVK